MCALRKNNRRTKRPWQIQHACRGRIRQAGDYRSQNSQDEGHDQ